MKKIFVTMLFAFAACSATAHAQGVGINGTGAAADTSAILDLSATNKGLLLPRMTAAQRAAIVLPANGLVIYQTDGTAGLYYNSGTSGAPSWLLVGANAVGGQWSASGSNLYYSTGKVAVGVPPAGYRFEVQDTGAVLRVQANRTNSVMASFGGAGQIQIDAPGVVAGRLSLLDNGYLGLGNVNPATRLSFGAELGKKISLYPSISSDYGFGIASGRLQIFSDGNSGGDVAIGTDAAGTFTERFAVKNNGALAVGGNTGGAGQVLQSNGSAAAATWVTPAANVWSLNGTNAYYNAGSVGIGTNAPNAPLGFPATLGRKITLYPGTLGNAGIGMTGNRVQIYSDNPNADVALGYDAAGAFNERFAFKPTGAMAVNGNAGAAGQVLQSNGAASAATWVSPTNSAYNNFYLIESTNSVSLAAYANQALPDMSQTFSLAGNARVTVDFSIFVYATSCGLCGPTLAEVRLYIDGAEVHDWRSEVNNGSYVTITGSFTRTLAAGSHTIQINGEPYTQGAAFGSPTPKYGNVMSIQVTPQ